MYKTLATGTYTKAIFHYDKDHCSITTNARQFKKCMDCGFVDMSYARYNATHDKTTSCAQFSRWCEQKRLALCQICVSLLKQYKDDILKLNADYNYIKHCHTVEAGSFRGKWLHPRMTYGRLGVCSYVKPVATTGFAKMADVEQAGVKFLLSCGYGSIHDDYQFAIVGNLKYPIECYLGNHDDDRGELCDQCIADYVQRRKLVLLCNHNLGFTMDGKLRDETRRELVPMYLSAFLARYHLTL